MILNNLIDFKNNLKKGRIIGLDVGRKTIGVALSDRDWFIATPKMIIQRKSTIKDINVLINYIKMNDVCAIVSGIPLNSNNEKIENCSYIEKFIIQLDQNINDLPIFFENEFLSSFMVEDFMIDNMNMKFNKVKHIVDKSAAAIILQDVLDKLK